ncbi:MAG TPA: hypothetical protein VGM06_22145 [Polyangiaceae bacterium]
MTETPAGLTALHVPSVTSRLQTGLYAAIDSVDPEIAMGWTTSVEAGKSPFTQRSPT